jgi:hypothetical protein
MRWVTEERQFATILTIATDCLKIDEGVIPSGHTRLVFDSSELRTASFLSLLKTLLRLSASVAAYYVVLDPHPVTYFHRHFGKFSMLEVGVDDSPKSFLAALNEDPGESPADAVGTNWFDYIICLQRKEWFIRGMRADNDGGHLWVPPEWTEEITGIHMRPFSVRRWRANGFVNTPGGGCAAPIAPADARPMFLN